MGIRRSRDARLLITCLAVLLVLVVLRYNVSVISNIQRTHSIKSQDIISRVPESISSVERLRPPPRQSSLTKEINCTRAPGYNVCRINGPAVLDPTVSTFFVKNLTNSTLQKPLVEKVRGVALVAGPPSPKCDVYHNSPALVYNASRFDGHFFHEFNGGFIPLYVTVNTVFPDQDVVLVVAEARDWWIIKYKEVLSAFSKTPIIILENDTNIHCFPSASVGMIAHGFMTVDPELIPNSKTLTDFHFFLDKAYAQNRDFQNQYLPSVENRPKDRPLLLLFGRKGAKGRVLLNQKEVKLEAEKVGFEVIIYEPKLEIPLREAYALINSSHAVVGIHGSALTHLLFLRPGSVLVQVVPLGLDLLSDACFTTPATAMGLEYMEYRITPEESSLPDKYDKDDIIIKDPATYTKLQENKMFSFELYLREQDVKLDLVRFREHLEEVYVKAKKFMEREG